MVGSRQVGRRAGSEEITTRDLIFGEDALLYITFVITYVMLILVPLSQLLGGAAVAVDAQLIAMSADYSSP